jgi:capsule polysaccharide export protein KpsE/RkpR
MTDRDPNTSAAFPASGTLPHALEIGDILAGEPALMSAPAERAAHESMTARLRLLWERRRFLFKVFVWSFALSLLIAFLWPKRYESTARLMPPDNQPTSSMAMLAALGNRAGGNMGALAGDLLGFKSSGALFTGILESRTAQDDLINRFDLKKVYSVRLLNDARSRLASSTSISEDRKSGIITITVTDKDPQRAAAMTQEYVAELNLIVNQLNTSAAHRERVFLEERLNQVKEDLESAEKNLGQFASKNTAIDIKEQGKAMVEAAATLKGQLIAVHSELEGLKQIYADNNVRIRTVRARVAELQHQLDKLGGKGEGSQQSTAADDSLYPSIRKLPLLGVSYADLFRRAKVQEAVFEALTQEYELAKVQEAKETPSVKVLDPPSIPETKSFPPRRKVILVGTALAMLLAIFWILGEALWNEIDPEDPRKALALEVYRTAKAYVPWASAKGSRLAAPDRGA